MTWPVLARWFPNAASLTADPVRAQAFVDGYGGTLPSWRSLDACSLLSATLSLLADKTIVHLCASIGETEGYIACCTYADMSTEQSNPVLQLAPGEQVTMQTLDPDSQITFKALPNS
jgi:hypothetical protein